MLEDQEQLQKFINTITELLDANEEFALAEILRSANINAEQTGYDNWNCGIYFYTISIAIAVDKFVKLQSLEIDAETNIKANLELIL